MMQFQETPDGKQSLSELLEDPSINTIIDSCLGDDCEDLYAVDEVSVPVPDRDGEVRLHISPDKMTVTADFYPKSGKGEKITETGVISNLLEMEILQTLIDLEALGAGLKVCNETELAAENIIIASGIDPEPRIPAHIDLFLNPANYVKAVNEIILKKENGKVDYKDFSQICILEKGTPVGQWIDETPGFSGMDIYGSPIPYQTVKIDQIKIGKNLRRKEEGDIVTTVDGEFIYEDDEIRINEILTLNDGINFKTGHIRFPGSVVINGEVEDDFNIKAEKNIYITNSLAASDVVCGGSLIVTNGGIIGRKQHKVMVRDIVETIHTKTVHLEAEKGIYITKGALDSDLYTNGEIIFGATGRITGGKAYAKDGFHGYIVGSESSVNTLICCGIDYKDIQKLFALKKYHFELKEAKNKSANRIDESTLRTLDQQILKCNLSLEQVVGKMQYNENAVVVVQGTIFPGSIINICHIKYAVKEELRNVTFSLDKKAGEIVYRKN